MGKRNIDLKCLFIYKFYLMMFFGCVVKREIEDNWEKKGGIVAPVDAISPNEIQLTYLLLIMVCYSERFYDLKKIALWKFTRLSSEIEH